MSALFVNGLGCVSPAGWGVPALRQVLNSGVPVPSQELPRPNTVQKLRVRPIPAPPGRPEFLSHPRLRRASTLTQYAAAAALEALKNLPQTLGNNRRLGLVVCLQSGPVQYVSRFLEELFKDPATASPMLFPETVFAAPASHIASLLGHTSVATSLIGDPGTFLQAIALAAEWLQGSRADLCLVIGAEEINWIQADASWYFEHNSIISAGAGALCLSTNPKTSIGVELAAITEPHTYRAGRSQREAAQAMRKDLPPGEPHELLCEGVINGSTSSRAEQEAWHDWTGARLSPKALLGDGLMAGSAWQCVAACDTLAEGRFSAANVSVVGNNQQAIGARFIRNSG
jgi:hypothetical protein